MVGIENSRSRYKSQHTDRKLMIPHRPARPRHLAMAVDGLSPLPIKQKKHIKPKHSEHNKTSHHKHMAMVEEILHRHKTTPKDTKAFSKNLSLALLIVMVVVNIYLIYGVFSSTSILKASTGIDRQSETEGDDEYPVSKKDINAYKVAADLPRVINIPSISVEARVMQMSVKADGQLDAPKNVHDTGWYTGSSKPGYSGATLINGHVSGVHTDGVFKNLSELQVGSKFMLENGKRKVFKYKVEKIETVKAKNVNMEKLLEPYSGKTQGLNLITCGGKYDAQKREYSDRVLVYTSFVE